MLHINEEGQLRSVRMGDGTFKKIHAVDPPVWWCDGRFSVDPERWMIVGPISYPIYRCRVCGDELHIHDAPTVREHGDSEIAAVEW